MLVLALIPSVTLLILILLFLRTQFQYRAQVQQQKKSLQQEMQNILAADAANDAKLVERLVGGENLPSVNFKSYNDTRIELLPSVGQNWHKNDLQRHATEKHYSQIKSTGRQLFYRTTFHALLVVFIAAGIAIVRYHFYSSPVQSEPSAEHFSSQVDDPFAAID